MLSAKNRPLNKVANDEDFTLDEYRTLVQLAIQNYEVAGYSDAEWSDSSVLWRHDVDFSVDHALVLAKIEKNEG